jgi:hypothetical protein
MKLDGDQRTVGFIRLQDIGRHYPSPLDMTCNYPNQLLVPRSPRPIVSDTTKPLQTPLSGIFLAPGQAGIVLVHLALSQR